MKLKILKSSLFLAVGAAKGTKGEVVVTSPTDRFSRTQLYGVGTLVRHHLEIFSAPWMLEYGDVIELPDPWVPVVWAMEVPHTHRDMRQMLLDAVPGFENGTLLICSQCGIREVAVKNSVCPWCAGNVETIAETKADDDASAKLDWATNVDNVIAERGKVYGDPDLSCHNIGLEWTGMIQQHYDMKLDHPLPNWMVSLMLTVFKAHRACRVWHEDNYTDAKAYLKFAEQQQGGQEAKS